LRSWLSPEQLAHYDTLGHFTVVGSDTGKRYRISRGRVFNIQELNAGGSKHCTWCFAPEDVATGDVNLAQKIALENFETKALQIANRSSLSARQSVQRPSAPGCGGGSIRHSEHFWYGSQRRFARLGLTRRTTNPTLLPGPTRHRNKLSRLGLASRSLADREPGPDLPPVSPRGRDPFSLDDGCPLRGPLPALCRCRPCARR
jgi:hypothetical protein